MCNEFKPFLSKNKSIAKNPFTMDELNRQPKVEFYKSDFSIKRNIVNVFFGGLSGFVCSFANSFGDWLGKAVAVVLFVVTMFIIFNLVFPNFFGRFDISKIHCGFKDCGIEAVPKK